jgi:DNA-binding transcriptional LysR family regulator
MQFSQVRMLVAVIGAGTVSGAARALGVSQPAVSQSLRALERELGVPLFVRSGRTLSPTTAARSLAAAGEHVVRAWDDTERTAATLRGRSYARLRIAASTTPGAYVVPSAMKTYMASLPDVDVDLSIVSLAEAIGRVRDGHADVAIVADPLPDDPSVDHEAFQRDELIPVWATDSPLMDAPGTSLPALLGQPFIAFPPGDGIRRSVDAWAASRALELPIPRLELPTVEAVVQSVIAGLGVSIISEVAAQGPLDAGLLATGHVPGLPIRRSVRVVLRRGGPCASPAVELVRQLLGRRRATEFLRRVRRDPGDRMD